MEHSYKYTHFFVIVSLENLTVSGYCRSKPFGVSSLVCICQLLDYAWNIVVAYFLLRVLAVMSLSDTWLITRIYGIAGFE